MNRRIRFRHNNIRYYRKIWGYTLKDVAFLLGLNDITQISRWETGKEMPSLASLIKLAYIFRTPCERLFNDYRKLLTQPIQKREQVLAKRLRTYDK